MLPTTTLDCAPVALADDARVVGFAYDTLPPDDARELREVTARMRDRAKASEIENGRDLIAVKSRLAAAGGAFGAWLHAEFRMSERTAQNYMATAREFGDHPAVVAVLPPGTLYKLAAPSTPETIRQDVIRRVEEGERPEPAAIRETITAAKRARQQAEEAERRDAERAKLTSEVLAERARKEEKSRKARDRREAQQQSERQARRQRIEDVAGEVAGLIADRLDADDLAQVLTHAYALDEGREVWDEVRGRLKAISAERRAPEAAAA